MSYEISDDISPATHTLARGDERAWSAIGPFSRRMSTASKRRSTRTMLSPQDRVRAPPVRFTQSRTKYQKLVSKLHGGSTFLRPGGDIAPRAQKAGANPPTPRPKRPSEIRKGLLKAAARAVSSNLLAVSDRQALKKIGIDDESLQVECWFNFPSVAGPKSETKVSGQWERGIVSRVQGASPAKAFFVNYGGEEGEWPQPVPFTCTPGDNTWRPGWPSLKKSSAGRPVGGAPQAKRPKARPLPKPVLTGSLKLRNAESPLAEDVKRMGGPSVPPASSQADRDRPPVLEEVCVEERSPAELLSLATEYWRSQPRWGVREPRQGKKPLQQP